MRTRITMAVDFTGHTHVDIAETDTGVIRIQQGGDQIYVAPEELREFASALSRYADLHQSDPRP